MKMLSVSLTAAAILSTACGGMRAAKSQKTEFGDDKPKAVSLAGKSPAEVLKAKYTRAEIVCRAFKGVTESNIVKFDQVKSPSELRVNLLEQSDLQKIDTLKVPLPNQDGSQARAWVYISGVSITDRLTHLDSAGNIYEMQYTPRVKVQYSFDHLNAQGLTTAETGGWELSENTPPLEFFSTNADQKMLDSGQHHAHGLSCSIETDIKPEYQNQFKVTKKK